MTIAILADELSYHEIADAGYNVEWLKCNNLNEITQKDNIFCVFNLYDDAAFSDYSNIMVPVFINSVCQTLNGKNHGKHVVRLNGWKGFLKRETWETSGNPSEVHLEVMDVLGKKSVNLPDEPGFVAPRVISMIINEAYFTKSEKVSTEEEINIAMKLGTNYPKGPFEWKNEIGIRNVYELLKALSLTDSRYQPSELLEKEALYP